MRIELGADGRWRVYDAAGNVLSEWVDRPQAIVAAAALAPSADGVPFTVPLLMPEGVWSSDGRMFELGTVTARPTPLTVMMQTVTDEGHDGAFVFGRLDAVTRDSQGRWSGSGVTYNSPEATEGVRLVSGGFVDGISVDAAASVFEDQSEFEETDAGGLQIRQRVLFKDGQIAGCTVCATPAFAGARIVMGSPADQTAEPMAAAAVQVVTAGVQRAAAKSRALVASAELTVVTEPPSEWFTDPGFTDDTTLALPGFPGKRGCPLTILPSGQVFGHVAIWDVPHIAYTGEKIYAPRSQTDYAYFQTGAVLCADGQQIATGPLTVATGHADMDFGAQAARAHYDDTGFAASDVALGEDPYGIWCAGYVRPGATREQIAALRASGLSGDWRPIGTGLELVAALSVNVPGFPVARARVAAGQVMALVAAGGPGLLQRAAREPWRAEIDDLRAAVDGLREQVARYGPAVRPLAASAALARAKAATGG